MPPPLFPPILLKGIAVTVDRNIFTGAFFPDTADISSLTLYASFHLREYRDEENRFGANGLLSSPNGVFVQADHRSSWMGAHLTQTLALPGNSLLVGASLERRQIEGSPALGRRRQALAAAWAKDELSVGPLSLALYGRLDGTPLGNGPGVGADARLAMGPSLALFGGLSVSRRFPTLMETSWTDSAVERSGSITLEHHRVAEAGLEWTEGDRSVIRLSLSHRQVTDPIVILPGTRPGVFPSLLIRNGPAMRITTADISASVRFWHLLVEGTGTYFLDRSATAQSR